MIWPYSSASIHIHDCGDMTSPCTGRFSTIKVGNITGGSTLTSDSEEDSDTVIEVHTAGVDVSVRGEGFAIYRLAALILAAIVAYCSTI